VLFPVSGVETPLWLPPVVAAVISFFTSMAGVSGAFLLLPFQMSFLGFTSPAVSPTNLVFNIVGIPGGVWRYLREGRMVWPLAAITIAGTLPGVIGGGLIRLELLPDPRAFKAFAGCVLLYIGLRMFWDLVRGGKGKASQPPPGGPWRVEVQHFSWRRLVFTFGGQTHACSTWGVFLMALAVGVVGGVYGIGGGAIIAPFFVAIYRLPVHAVAGAALMGTFVTSVVGVIFYQVVAPWYAGSGMAVAPDWLLGGLFGLGGLAGMYLGARTQRLVPASWLKVMLGLILLGVAGRYIYGWFAG
jgi:hypothetical protein